MCLKWEKKVSKVFLFQLLATYRRLDFTDISSSVFHGPFQKGAVRRKEKYKGRGGKTMGPFLEMRLVIEPRLIVLHTNFYDYLWFKL